MKKVTKLLTGILLAAVLSVTLMGAAVMAASTYGYVSSVDGATIYASDSLNARQIGKLARGTGFYVEKHGKSLIYVKVSGTNTKVWIYGGQCTFPH